jgi:hypothetical protein
LRAPATNLRRGLARRVGDCGVCQLRKYPLCFNGRFGAGKIGKPVDFNEFSPFPVGSATSEYAIVAKFGRLFD